MVFVHRSSLRVLDVELSALLPTINVTRKPAYEAAAKTVDGTTYSDDNPITRNYAPMPWRPARVELERAMRPHLNHPAPAVPASLWQTHPIFNKDWAHLFINTDYPWRDIAKDWSTTSPWLIAGFLYEYFLVGEYRRKIIQGPGGELRHILLDKLPRDLTEAIVIKVDDVETLIWWDGFVAPRLQRASDEVYLKRSVWAKVQQKHEAEIANIVKVIGKSSVAKLSTGRYTDDNPPLVASDVEAATAHLVNVRISFQQ